MVCPVCTVAVAAGVGVLEELGVDRIIIGLWFGALIVSSVLWMIDWMNRKNYHFIFRKLIVTVSFFIIFIIPLYYLKTNGMVVMGSGIGTVLGIDRLFFGTILGCFIFLASVSFNEYLKKSNEGRVMFNYQKVFIPVLFLIMASIISYLVIKII